MGFTSARPIIFENSGEWLQVFIFTLNLSSLVVHVIFSYLTTIVNAIFFKDFSKHGLWVHGIEQSLLYFTSPFGPSCASQNSHRYIGPKKTHL